MRKKRILLLLACFALFACDYPLHLYHYDELVESVTRVELINYHNPDAKTIRGTENLLPFDFDKMEIIATMRKEMFDAFFKEFTKYDIFYRSKHLDSPKGRSIRLIYENDDFEIVCKAEYSGRFDNNGNVMSNIGDGLSYVFEDLISRYFDL